VIHDRPAVGQDLVVIGRGRELEDVGVDDRLSAGRCRVNEETEQHERRGEPSRGSG
jgi:hypothetical protein